MRNRFDSSSDDSTSVPVNSHVKAPPLNLSESDDSYGSVGKNQKLSRKAPILSDTSSSENSPPRPKKNRDFDSDYSESLDHLESSAVATLVAKTIQTPVTFDDETETTEIFRPSSGLHPLPPNLNDSDYSDSDKVAHPNITRPPKMNLDSFSDSDGQDSDQNDNDNDVNVSDEDDGDELNDEAVLEVFDKLNKVYARGDDPIWEVDIEEIPEISNKNVITKMREENAALKLLKRIREQDK